MWKPYESDLGCGWRLSISNRLPVHEKRKNRANFYTGKADPLLPLPGQSIAESDISTYKIIGLESDFLIRRKNKEMENFVCPTCKEVGYHSWLYDMEWLNYCPIHNIELCKGFTALPPKYIRVFSGRISSLFKDSNGDLFSAKKYFQHLNPIAKFINYSKYLQAIHFYSPFYSEFIHNLHVGVSVNDKIFPSMLGKIFPHAIRHIDHTKIPLTKVIKIEVPRSNIPNIHNFYFTHVKINCYYIRNKIRNRIINLIQHYRGNKYNKKFLEESTFLGNFFSDIDVLYAAYHIWQSLACWLKSDEKLKNINGKMLYTQIFGSSFPLTPTPMMNFNQLDLNVDSLPYSQHKFITHNLIPLSLTSLIYEIDCWCLFRSIVTFLSTVKKEERQFSDKNFMMIDLIKKIPDFSKPNSIYNKEIAAYIKEDKFIILFPYYYVDPYCYDLNVLYDFTS